MPMTNQRLIRDCTVLFKVESTQNTDSSPATGDAVLVLTGVDFEPAFNQVDREISRPYLGASEQLIGSKLGKLSLRHEISGFGTAGSAPAWNDTLIACGFAQALLTTPTRVEYTPVSTGFQTATAYVYAAGVLYKLVGCMGNATLDFTVGQTPKLIGEFTGLYQDPSAATIAAPTFGVYKTPGVVTASQVVDVTIGATYSAGAISGGFVYPSRGISVNLGNSVQHMELASSEYMVITERDSVATFTLDLTATQELSFMSGIASGDVNSIAFTINGTAGKKFILFMPSGQIQQPKVVNINGARMLEFTAKLVPSSAGNDEVRLVQL